MNANSTYLNVAPPIRAQRPSALCEDNTHVRIRIVERVLLRHGAAVAVERGRVEC